MTISLLTSERFDLCILEYALPDMTGVQLCSLVRQLGIKTPMMFFSAMSRSIDKENATAAGADAYLCKPEDLDIFAVAAIRLLQRPERPFGMDTGHFFLQRAA